MALLRVFILATALATAGIAQSTTVCSLTGCNSDNCYRNVQKSTTFCASFTAGPPVTTTAGLNPTQASCGPTRLSSACSCLYPPGATTEKKSSSITQCTVVTQAPSPTVFSYDFSNPTNPPVSVIYAYDLGSSQVVTDPPNAHSQPNMLKATWPQGGFGNIEYGVSGVWRPNSNYSFTFWAKQDPADANFDYINLLVYAEKNDPATTNATYSNNLVNRLLHPAVDVTWNKWTSYFSSREDPYYVIAFYFNIGTGGPSKIIPALYIDDVSLVQV